MLNSKILIFLLSFFTAAFVYSVLLFFMPKTPVFYVPVKKEFEFYKINLTPLFYRTKPVKKPVVKKAQTLKGIKLKAVYDNGKNGFIIIEDKGKTHFIDLGQKYKGYKLIKINSDSAIFEKNSKHFKIEFDRSKIESNFYKKIEQSFPKKIKINKKTYLEYKNDLLKVWENIGIIKINNGYMITYIKPKSIFDKIGLKRGDIILEVNGRELKNDEDAWDLYKNADKFKEFEIKVKRNNKEKVLYYEVD